MAAPMIGGRTYGPEVSHVHGGEARARAAPSLILADTKSSVPAVSSDLGTRLGLPACGPGVLWPGAGLL